MDEVHFLADRMRGAVWEEVILHLPEEVRLVSLSATVSNAEEFGGWIKTVRGDTTVVVDEHRPVPLWQHVLVGKRLFDLFDLDASGPKNRVDPELMRHIANRREADRLADWQPRRRGPGRPGGPGLHRPPSRPDVIATLDHEGLLPAITFIFSRAGCDAAVKQCLRSPMRLTTEADRVRIAEVIDRRCGDLADADLVVLDYYEWREGLLRGLAAHHAGMLPTFRHTVEELFTAGLIKAVFATETLALGINMPARTVVLEKLVKFNGEQHLPLTPGEYTQLTGRAGRRGIDVEGHAVVVWNAQDSTAEPTEIAGLASTRTFPLRSSFAPSYNMTINLVSQMTPAAARQLLERSFAQYQADRSVVGLVRGAERGEKMLDEIAGELGWDRGAHDTEPPILDYARLRVTIGERERAQSRVSRLHRRQAANDALVSLRRGDIINITHGRRGGLAVVLEPGRDSDDPRPLVLTENRWAGRISSADYPGEAGPIGSMTLPKRVEHRQPRVRRDLASALLSAAEKLSVPSERRRRGGDDAPDVDVAAVLDCEDAAALTAAQDDYRLRISRTDRWGRTVSQERPLPDGGADWAQTVRVVCWSTTPSELITIDSVAVRTDLRRGDVSVQLDLSSRMPVDVQVGTENVVTDTVEIGRTFSPLLYAGGTIGLEVLLDIRSCVGVSVPAFGSYGSGYPLPGPALVFVVSSNEGDDAASTTLGFTAEQAARIQRALDGVCAGAPDVRFDLLSAGPAAQVRDDALLVPVTLRLDVEGGRVGIVSLPRDDLTSDPALLVPDADGTVSGTWLVYCGFPQPMQVDAEVVAGGRTYPWRTAWADEKLADQIVAGCPSLSREVLTTYGWPPAG